MAKKKIKIALLIFSLILLSAGAFVWWISGEQIQALVTRFSFIMSMTFAPSLPEEGVKIPLQMLDGRLFIEQPQANNSNFFLQVDTGCSASSFDPEVPLQVKASGATSYSIPGSMKNKHLSPIFYFSGFKFAGQTLPTMAVAGNNMDRASCRVGRRVYGVIGQDILGNFSVELDYPNKLMILRPLPKRRDKGLKWDTGCPTVSVKYGDRLTVGIVDCGSDIFTIPEADAHVLSAVKTRHYMLMDEIKREGRMGTAPITVGGKTFSGLPVGAGTYDCPLVGNQVMQFFSVKMESNNCHVNFQLHDWKGGDNLRAAQGSEQWQKAIKLIGEPFPEDWREVNALLECYHRTSQFDKASELAHRQIEKFPSEKAYWLIIQAGYLHQAKKDDQAEELLASYFISKNADPYTIVACVKALSDNEAGGIAVCRRLLRKYPHCRALTQIKEQLQKQTEAAN